MTDDEALAHWLKTVQGTALRPGQVINPARSGKPLAEVVETAGGGRRFDTEPARYYQLLKALAPGGAGRE